MCVAANRKADGSDIGTDSSWAQTAILDTDGPS